MLRIGLTGGIGSGKSTIAKIFESLNVPVYYADDAARRLMQEDAGLVENIQHHFGKEAYAGGKLNRPFISGIVFNDSEKLNLLNGLVHPATIKDAALWIQRQQAPYIIKEAALLFESDAKDGLDYIIGVYAPKSLRIHRVMKRDGINKDAIEKRMSRQIDENIKMKLCDFIITNNEQQLVVPQVLELHSQFMKQRIIRTQ